MKAYMKYFSLVLIVIVSVVGVWPLQAGENKKVLTMDDYGRWRTVSSTQLSPDGEWMTYDYRKPEANEDAPDSIFVAFSPANAKSKDYAQILGQGMDELRRSGKLKAILSKYGMEDWQ